MWLARKNQKKAVESFQKGTSFAGNSDVRMQMLLALAREQEKIGDKKAAAKAYREILRMNPDKEVSFYSELSLARLSRETGQIDDAVNTLVDMLDTPLYMDYDGQIQLEIGRLYEAVSEYPAAVDQYRFVDTTFRNKPESAEASFALGKMYEEKGKNYDKAFEHYGNARTAYPGIEASFRGGLKADDFAEYRRMRNRMFDMDTLLYFVLHPDSLARRDSLQVIADSVASVAAKKSGSRGAMTEDERLREKFARRRPHGRNSGRVNPYEAQTSPGSLVAQPMGGTGAVGKQSVPPGQALYRKYNIRKLSPDSVLQNLSVIRMDFGWILFDRVKDLDSAFYYYRMAVDGKLPDSVKANAYYTLAEISRRMGDSALAADYENRLIRELPQTRYALSVMRERGIELPKDSIVVTREAYDRAARVLETSGPIAGLAALERMRDSYPHSEQAVRAKLAIAMTYETLPGKQEQALTVYRDMVKNHPNSKYSKRAKDILGSIERAPIEEEERRKKAEETKRLAAEQEAKKLREIKQSFPTPKIDTSRTTRLKRRTDPTLDDDFPLNLPGEKSKNPPKLDSTRQQSTPNPLEPSPQPGDPVPAPQPPAPLPPGKTRLNAEPEEKQEPLSTPRKGP
jgi:tetratricopeptide (TPR) repeat protein